ELVGVWGPVWARTLRPHATRWVFRRGFIDKVWLTARQFLDGGSRLFCQSPVRSVHLSDCVGGLRNLLASPFLKRLTSLDFRFNHLHDADVRQLTGCTGLQNLTDLDLGHNDVSDDGVEVLATSPCLTNLTKLGLGFNQGISNIGA